MNISVGICAYNEEKNIGQLLARLKDYPFELIVVASGCTDRTIPIVKRTRAKLIIQEKREGKASAVNAFLEKAKGDILVLCGADIIPSAMCFKYLLSPFEDISTGMVGAHPIPIDWPDNLNAKIAHLLWNLHHHSALLFPKAGEVCAFRNIVESIDPHTLVDEASIEQQIAQQGYSVRYAPKAIVFNKGTGSLGDFIRQRTRIYRGHLTLRDNGYIVPTMSYANLLRAILKSTGGHYRTLLIASVLELYARHKAKQSYQDNGIWEIINSTKELK